jgi:hypothetical protein
LTIGSSTSAQMPGYRRYGFAPSRFMATKLNYFDSGKESRCRESISGLTVSQPTAIMDFLERGA